MRVSREKLEAIKKKYNVDELFSWSKYNTYKIDPYSYYLKYIKKIKENRENPYSFMGGKAHSIIEDFYEKKIKYSDMIEKFEDAVLDKNIKKLKYNRKDEKANEKIGSTYENTIRHFYKNHIPIEGKVIIEQFVTINVNGNIFQGYIDFIHKEGKDFIITDWKTSTIYTGKKIEKERGQLVLYAESLIQKGISIDSIKIRWNFLKYCTVTSQLAAKDKTTKEFKAKQTNALRNEWVNKIQSNLKMWLKKDGFEEFEINDMVFEAVSNNNLDNIPEHIKYKYKIEDCYIYIPLDQEIIDNLKLDITETLNEIEANKKSFDVLNDERLWWTSIDKSNEFFFGTLCGYSRKLHKPYDEYLKDQDLFKSNKKDEKEDDFNWIDELD